MRVMRSRDSSHQMLEALASPRTAMPAWLRALFEDPSLVVVVPEMSAIHQLGAFNAEVFRRAGDLDDDVAWIVGRPPHH